MSSHHINPSAILLFEALPSNFRISHQTPGSSNGSSGGMVAGLVPVAPVAVEELAFDVELELFLDLGGCFDGGGCSGSLL